MIRLRLLPAAALALLFLLVIQAVPMFAQEDDYPEGAEGGRMLAANLSNMQPETNEGWKGVLRIYQKKQKMVTIPVFGQSIIEDPRWKVIYLSSAIDGMGAESLTVVHITNAPNQYLYARAPAPGAALGEPKSLIGDEADIPLAGSDFWLSDLGFEFYHWPQQIRHKGEMKRGRACYILESINPQPKPDGYARVVTWIDKETGGPIQATAYGADNKPLKEFSIGSFKKINGRYELKEMEIRNVQAHSRTELEFDLERK